MLIDGALQIDKKLTHDLFLDSCAGSKGHCFCLVVAIQAHPLDHLSSSEQVLPFSDVMLIQSLDMR